MSDQEPNKLVPNLVEFLPDNEDAMIYANYAAASMSPSEIILRLGLLSADKPGKAKSIVRLYMPPSFAKELLQLLGGAVNQHEQMFGKIKTAIDFLTPEQRQQLGIPEDL